MEYKGRLERQVSEAIELLYEEGTILIPMDDEQYEENKDYKFTVVEEINKIQKHINYQVQMRLFLTIQDRLKGKKVTFIPSEGIIRLK